LKKLIPLHAVLEQRLKDHVTGAVGRVACAAHGGLAVVGGVAAAEAALVDLALGGAVERQPMFSRSMTASMASRARISAASWSTR
jgi:hypothetical protein